MSAASVCAADVRAPDALLADPAGLKSAFNSRIGHPVNVVRLMLGERYTDIVVGDTRDKGDFEKYSALPGALIDAGTQVPASDLSCSRKKIAFSDLDLAAGARALAQAREIAALNGYGKPDYIYLGANVFCNDFGWRLSLSSAVNSEAMLEIVWNPLGAAPQARQHKHGGFAKVDMKTLLAGGAKPAPEITYSGPTHIAGDGRKHEFPLGISADLARIEASIGGPQSFKSIWFDQDKLIVEVFLASDHKRIATWIENYDGEIHLSREEDAIFMDCNRPFSAHDVAVSVLPELVASAPSRTLSLEDAHIDRVNISRSVFCGAIGIVVSLENDYNKGDVEYDAHGKFIRATLDDVNEDGDEGDGVN